MELVLVRHGIAAERETWKGADADRPLTDKGAKRMVQVALGLKWLDVNPTHILSSPLARALETAGILRTVLAPRLTVKQVKELSPDAAPEELLLSLSRLPADSCVVCVGHEPHLGLTAGVMLAGKPSTSFSFKKGGVCLIEVSASVKPGRGTLQWWMGPAPLRVLGKKVKA